MTIQKPQTFEPDGRAIPFVDEGEGQVAVVLLPGRGLNISALGTLAHVLVEEGFRIIRVGTRRPADEPDLTLHDLAQDVVEVMTHLDLSAAWIGGHAFGGAVARTIARDHPERCEGVLLLGVEGIEPPTEEAAAALEILFTDAEGPNALDAVRMLAGEGIDPKVALTVFTRARDLGVAKLQDAALAATPVEEWSPLPEKGAVLIMQGTDDRITPPSNGERLQATAPTRASVARIEGGGHLFVLTHPGEIGAEIEDYLGWD